MELVDSLPLLIALAELVAPRISNRANASVDRWTSIQFVNNGMDRGHTTCKTRILACALCDGTQHGGSHKPGDCKAHRDAG